MGMGELAKAVVIGVLTVVLAVMTANSDEK